MLNQAFANGAIRFAWWWVVPPGVSLTLLLGALFLLARSIEGAVDRRLARLMTVRHPKADVVLEVDGLTINYGLMDGSLDAVREVSFQLGRGRALGIVGESGCGKSTLARGIFGALPPNGKIVQGRVSTRRSRHHGAVTPVGAVAMEGAVVRSAGCDSIARSTLPRGAPGRRNLRASPGAQPSSCMREGCADAARARPAGNRFRNVPARN